jgi:hypothetical protein
MAVTAHVYPVTMDKINKKLIDLTITTAGTWFALLMTGNASAWTSTEQAFAFVSDVTGAYTEVASGGGYSTGGIDISSGVTLTRTNNTDKWSCTSPINFGATTTITARSMLIYTKQVGSGTTSWPAVSIIDFGANVISTAGAYTYTVDPTNGLALWTAS